MSCWGSCFCKQPIQNTLPKLNAKCAIWSSGPSTHIFQACAPPPATRHGHHHDWAILPPTPPLPHFYGCHCGMWRGDSCTARHWPAERQCLAARSPWRESATWSPDVCRRGLANLHPTQKQSFGWETDAEFYEFAEFKILLNLLNLLSLFIFQMRRICWICWLLRILLNLQNSAGFVEFAEFAELSDSLKFAEFGDLI